METSALFRGASHPCLGKSNFSINSGFSLDAKSKMPDNIGNDCKSRFEHFLFTSRGRAFQGAAFSFGSRHRENENYNF